MFTRILAKTGILTTLCLYPSVEALSETRYLNRASLTLACVCALQSVRQRKSAGNGARVPKHVQMIHFTLWCLNLSVNPKITCVPNRGDWSVWIMDHLRSVAPLTKTIHCVVFVVNRLLTSYKPNYYNPVIKHTKKIFVMLHSLVCKGSANPLLISDMLDG